MHLVIADIHSIITQVWNDMRMYTQKSPDLNSFFKKVLNLTAKEFRRERFTHACIVWPDYSSSRRRQKDPMYDFDRLVLPNSAFPLIMKLNKRFQDLGFAVMSHPGVEAFDIMAYFVQKIGGRDDVDVTLITKDDRAWSLISDSVKVSFGASSGANNLIMTPTRFDAMFGEHGLKPNQYLSHKLLSDMDGLGPQKAYGLLKKYGTLEEIDKVKDEIEGRAGKVLQSSMKSQGRQLYRRYFPLKIEKLGITLADLIYQNEAIAG